jgi:hypothetical protein
LAGLLGVRLDECVDGFVLGLLATGFGVHEFV